MQNHIEFPFIRKIMAGKPEDEIEEAEDRFARVLLILKGIAEREAHSKSETEGLSR